MNLQADYAPWHSLTIDCMHISEQSLSETWENENDEEWAQYLID